MSFSTWAWCCYLGCLAGDVFNPAVKEERPDVELTPLTIRVRRHAGIYQNKTYAPELKNILLLTTSEHLEMLLNWECFAKRLGLDWMVMDELHLKEPRSFLGPSWKAKRSHVGFKSCNKLRFLLDILRQTNLDIVFSHADNVFKSDPFLPSLTLGNMMRSGRYDFIYARDIRPGHDTPKRGRKIQNLNPKVYHQEPLKGNSGFYYVTGRRKQSILQHIFEVSVDWCDRRPSLDENFWDLLVATRKNNTEKGHNVCFRHCESHRCSGVNESMVLNYCDMSPWEYVSGSFSPESVLQEPRMVSYHAHAIGLRQKKDKLKKIGLWANESIGATTSIISISTSPISNGTFGEGPALLTVRNDTSRAAFVRANVAQVGSKSENKTLKGELSELSELSELEPVSNFSWVCDPQERRVKKKCPSKVRVHRWTARVGNHFFQISQAIMFALMCGSSTVLFPPPIYNKSLYQDQAGMLAIPTLLKLDRYRPRHRPRHRRHRRCLVPETCPFRTLSTANWYATHCKGPAWRYREVMHSFLRPNLGRELLAAEARPRRRYEDHALTVHLRGDDVELKPTYAVNQPPCRMYRRILADHRYTAVTVVYAFTKLGKGKDRGQPACASYFQNLGKRITVRMRANSVVEDFAVLMRARYIVLSFSSFALSAAILSKEVRVMYRQGNAEWDTVLHSILNCKLWPGVEMYEYNITVLNQPEDLVRLIDLPDENITGPFKCDHGREVQSTLKK